MAGYVFQKWLDTYSILHVLLELRHPSHQEVGRVLSSLEFFFRGD